MTKAGRMIARMTCARFAPSMSAASNKSGLILMIAVKKMIESQPRLRHASEKKSTQRIAPLLVIKS